LRPASPSLADQSLPLWLFLSLAACGESQTFYDIGEALSLYLQANALVQFAQ
jgi:hypothetical protein